jgi:hypothetical protein
MLTNEDRLKITNAMHCSFKTEENKMVEGLEQLILLAKDCYYSGYPFLDDYAYDQLEDLLKARNPDSVVLQKVGTSD